MFTLQRTLSLTNGSSMIQASVKLLSQSELSSSNRCVIYLLQQSNFHNDNNSTRWLSGAATNQTFNVSASQAKVLSSSVASNANVSGTTVSPGSSKGRTLPPYMVFRYCGQTSSTLGQRRQSTAGHSTLAFDITNADSIAQVETIASRPLVVLFAWMLSRNSHIEKYREFWMKRGYDILTVQTSPIDLLLPSVGGKRVAQNVFNFLSKITPRYDEVLVHAFSVGGYQLGELLDRLYEGIAQGDERAERLYKSLKGFLIDSVVFAEDAPPGLSRAITLHPIVQPVLEKSIAAFLKATKPFTFDRYKIVEAHIIDNKRQVPAMLLFSKDDIVSNWRSNHGVVEGWQRAGITTKAKCWETSAHVLHYREHPEEYEQEIDGFVSRLNITKASNRN